MPKNEKYSYGDFTGQDLAKTDPAEWNDTEVIGSCFYQEAKPGHVGDVLVEVFPPTMTGVTFRRCNLDNCAIPPGNTVIDDPADVDNYSCHRRIKVQNDRHDWVLDNKGKPTEPIDKKAYLRAGVSIDPRDLPAEMCEPDEDPVTKAERLAIATKERDDAQARLDDLNAELTP